MSRRCRSFARPLLALLLAGFTGRAAAAEFAFSHPGLLQGPEALARMSNAITAKLEPINAGYQLLRNHPLSQLEYRIRGPFAEIGRNPDVHFADFDVDASAAYQCALLWCLTGQRPYAQKAGTIINGWSATLKRCSGADAVLMAGLGPFKLLNAAELLRYTDSGWTEGDARQCERMFREVIYPVVKDGALFANGNWDAAATRMVLALGVFCDDRTLFERALRSCVNGAGNGALPHYIVQPSGQCQESGRDQPHTQLGLGLLADTCEIAWQQGLDLYAWDNHRLLHGFEYTAKYNLGENVPFVENRDCTGKYHQTEISARGRGRLRPIYEQVFNHYLRSQGIPTPYTQKAAERLRPEGPSRPAADHPGFGTLLFTQPADPRLEPRGAGPPAAPAGVVAQGSPTGNKLAWITPRTAESYTVKRASASAGPYRVLAANLRAPAYTDSAVEAGVVYYYTATASNAAGESPVSLPAGICAGLPQPWRQRNLGGELGGTGFDGSSFQLVGVGKEIGGTNDQCQFAFVPLAGDGSVTARFVPQISSQLSQFGLMLRAALAGDAAQVSLLFAPRFVEAGLERPSWHVALLTRAAPGGAVGLAGPDVAAPNVAYGRLTQPCWLRLERRGDRFVGSLSPDGQTWSVVSEARVTLGGTLWAGLTACSGLTQLSTLVQFEQVTVTTKR